EDDVADAALQRHSQLGLGLVVAVHVDPLRAESRREGEVKLAAGGDVAGKPLLGEDLQGRRAGKRLARVDDLEIAGASLGEGGDPGPGALAEISFRRAVGGGAESRGRVDETAPTNPDRPALLEPAPDRKPRQAPYGARNRLCALRH